MYTLYNLSTKLAQDRSFTRVHILNWGQLDKMNQVLWNFFQSQGVPENLSYFIFYHKLQKKKKILL